MSRLRQVLTDIQISQWYETVPVGVVSQPTFLNGAVTGATDVLPRPLLQRLLGVELERGRERPHAGAPRTLDLDLILYDGEVIDEPGLQVPHPRFRERLFVLEPLSEIAPDWIDPVTRLTISGLRLRLSNPS